MRPIDFHTSVARLPEAERLVNRGERPAVQQTFAAEVQKTMIEREQTVQRSETVREVRLDPRERQQQQQRRGKKKNEQEREKEKKRRHLDMRV